MDYSIKDELLYKGTGNGSWEQVEFFPTSNQSGKLDPQYLVIHFTAGRSDHINTAAWFQNPKARASAHLTLSKTGEWAQSVRFDTVAWHAGKSRWNNVTGLNKSSIGIEVCNPGPLTKTRAGYKAWWGSIINDDSIIEAPHANDPDGPVYGWVPFTEQQVTALIEVGSLLMQNKGLIECIGHDMIAPGRKTDPGPCMDYRVYEMINGARSDKGEDYVYKVATSGRGSKLNGRAGPGTNYNVVTQLTDGDVLDDVIQTRGNWMFVETFMGEEVWVHSKFIEKVSR